MEKLSDQEIQRLKMEVAPYLAMAPESLYNLVPHRNRISGNARVMRVSRMPPCPICEPGLLANSPGKSPLTWTPDRLDEIRCAKGHVIDPFKHFPLTGVIEIRGPRGDVQEYPYHDAPDGTRIYLKGEYMDALRVYHLCRAVKSLGVLYQLTREVSYAQRAAVILHDFARAVPHWPKIHRDGALITTEGRKVATRQHGKERFRPIGEYITYASIWYDKSHVGLGAGPDLLAEGYGLIVNSPVWEALDPPSSRDVRQQIEADLFLYTVKDAIRYDIRFPDPVAALSNYIPAEAASFMILGAAIGVPELVHYGYWKIEQLINKTLMADAVFPESPSYAKQHIGHMAIAADTVRGYTDPPGFFSRITRRHFEDLDINRDFPVLQNALAVLATMVEPDGYAITIGDTHAKQKFSGFAPLKEVTPRIYPAYGHAVLGGGTRERSNQIQAHLEYSGNWGHDHKDMLNFTLWAYRDELISDIGYAHTYRHFANRSQGHNLVVVNRQNQASVGEPGYLLGWHAPRENVQVVEVSAPMIYQATDIYRRALFFIPLQNTHDLVLDIFEVRGGDVHEWMAQGSGEFEQRMETTIPMRSYGESYADDRKIFRPSGESRTYMADRVKSGLPPWELAPGEKDPWYGVFRDVRQGDAIGPLVVRYLAEKPGQPQVNLHLLEPAGSRIFTTMVPALRRGAEEHASLAEKYWMPKVVVRRDGNNLHSRFVALWDPFMETGAVEKITDLAAGNPDLVALNIKTTPASGGCSIDLFYSNDPAKRNQVGAGRLFQGRYAAVIAGKEEQKIALYDCSYFKDEGVEIIAKARPVLPVSEVKASGTTGHMIVLEGVWDDIKTELIFDEPELVILTQDGSNQRAFPITSVTRNGARMVLHAKRDPGFEYNAAALTLTETYTPFRTVRGQAQVALPHRVLLQRSNREGASDWKKISATVPFEITSVARTNKTGGAP